MTHPSWLTQNIQQCEALLSQLYFERDQLDQQQTAVCLKKLRNSVTSRHCYERVIQDPDRVKHRRQRALANYHKRRKQQGAAAVPKPTSFRLEL